MIPIIHIQHKCLKHVSMTLKVRFPHSQSGSGYHGQKGFLYTLQSSRNRTTLEDAVSCHIQDTALAERMPLSRGYS